MGERALAAVRLEDAEEGGRWALYTSQWGGSDPVLGRVFAAPAGGSGPGRAAEPQDRLTALASVSWRPTGTVTGRLVEAVDFLGTSVVYVIAPRVTVWQALWFGFPLAESAPAPTDGVLVRARSIAGIRTRRRRLRQAKRLLSPAVAAGALPPADARRLLVGVLHSRVRVPSTQSGPL
ncbi:hypothetical protein BRC62_05515 [Halobacteriales archaeon QH_10_67_13]|nr:MAG: hypothetical protein BRC62_05515 [Halobacteriales archaeon QH_10_67_13]